MPHLCYSGPALPGPAGLARPGPARPGLAWPGLALAHLLFGLINSEYGCVNMGIAMIVVGHAF